jgi:2-polyprenyl-6-hydroxyphenyl methylase/3-demethylubiquinone-9 3-methyltransferase
MVTSPQHAQEVALGKRFEFGNNWRRFLDLLDDRRIEDAETSLGKMFQTKTLAGKTFLDIGSGSGLFSLAARRLGANVTSFDYDPASVGCTMELRRRYFPDDPDWHVEQGSVLDKDYVQHFGQFDIVYSWGVLHHTGSMWDALKHAAIPVKRDGLLLVAIYNDEGARSQRWVKVKQTYLKLPGILRTPYLAGFFVSSYWRRTLKDFLLLRPFHTFRTYGGGRGMSVWRDHVDWIGGYPFEVAKPEELFEFYKKLGFTLERMVTVNDLGCNEMVFRRQV